MRPPERVGRRLAGFGTAAFLCLALIAGAAAASTPAEARPAVGPAMNAHARPQTSDDMPCAGCVAASAPAVQGVGAEPGGTTEPAWRAQASAAPELSVLMHAGTRLPSLPLRIAFCRWLD